MRFPELAAADKTGRMCKEGWKASIDRVDAVMKDWHNSPEACPLRDFLAVDANLFADK